MIVDPVRQPSDTGTVDAENPWPGLAAFREADQRFFQGREAVVDELTRMVLRARLTVLHGVSGLGKTSVLRAGLFPRLRGEHLLPIYVRIGHSEDTPAPVEQVRGAIARAAQAAEVEAPRSTADQTLWEYFHRRDAQFWDARNRIVTPLLVFDQFEELFTLGRATAERRARTEAFVAELSDLVEGRPAAHVRARLETDPEEALRYSMSDQPCKVLLSLREDFLPDLAELRRSIPAITDTMYRLQPMTTAEAMRVVEIGGGGLVGHDVAEHIVRFVASARSDTGGDGAESVVEPALLSVFCRELNNKRRALGGDRITGDLLEGSRTAIISDFYERTISEGGLSQAIRLFVEERLLTESGFRDSVAEEQALRTPGITPADIDTLIARRLLRREDAGARERSRLELTHDVLAEAVRASRDRRRLREQQERAIAEQRAREERLRLEADEAAAREQQRREFEAAERLAYTERRARKRLSLVLVAIGVLAIAALYAAKRASDAESAANDDLAASYVDRVMPGEPWALPLLARAIRMDPDSTIGRALLVGHLARHVMKQAEMVHDAPVRRATFNSTGTRMLSFSGNGTVRLWDPRTGQAVGNPLGQVEHTTAASFSPDGTRVVTGSDTGTAQVWDTTSGKPVGAPLNHKGAINAASFDGTGERVVTASDDQTARIWHPGTGRVIEIAAASGPIEQAAFDSLGVFVLSVSAQGEAAVWDAASGAAVTRFGLTRDQNQAVAHAAFGPDGSRILALLMDGSARVIDTRTGQMVGGVLEEPQADPNEPRGTIVWARFDPSGARILTTAFAASTEVERGSVAIARLWDSGTGALLPMTMQHDDWINRVDFSADGSLLLTASRDGTARVWDATTGLPLGHPLRHKGLVEWAGFSPDGRRVLTASEDGTAQLWDVHTGLESSAVLRHDGPVTSAAFSPDGSMIVTASRDRAHTWDARTGVIVETRLRHPEGLRVTLAALSADAAYVATAGNLDPDLPEAERVARAEEEQVVRVWDSATGQQVGAPVRHAGPLNSISFGPAGTPRLVTASADGTARIWDLRAGAPIGEALQHRGPVFAAAFNAEGTRIITASADGSARIWEASSGNALTDFNHCNGTVCAEVRSAVFSPDSTRVVTGASDGNARVWNVATGELAATLPLRCATERIPGDVASIVASVSFSPDGARLLTSSYGESLVWNVDSLEAILPCLGHEGALNLPLFGQDEQRHGLQIVTMSTVDAARLWDVWPEPAVRWELPREIAVLSAAFSGDGRLVTGSRDGASRTWNVRTGKDAGLTLDRDTEPVWTAFSRDGSRIVTLATDGVARIWDVPAGSPGDAPALADLAETVTGHALDSAGARHLERSGALAELRNRAARQPPGESFADTLAHWLFADPATRTISPTSRITVPEYVARLRREGESGEREAMRLFPWLSPARR